MPTQADKGLSKKNAYAPSKYMRQRHPHLFSDSAIEPENNITREVLSYHLETLTNQKQEVAFESFAHRLCEKYIAPNLRPQTGPTGGGDGKTDAETYPVVEEVALRWFCPEAPKAGERFAFAFSAMKDWRTKVKSDVKSIVSTSRGYDHIFFVTNQFVPARHSADVQDKLKKQHGISVTILDRNWLLDRVFDHHSLDIAVKELGVGAGTERQRKKVGPKDYERQQEFDELERAIQNGTKYQGQPHALAEDTLRTAILARGLERPASEVNALFYRAVRIAKDRELTKSELAATYDWAWTSYFWFEDYVRTNELYFEIERLALDSEESEDLERLNNIMPLLRMSVRTNNLAPVDAELDERTKRLNGALERVSAITSRPNNALHAKAILLMMQMSERVTADQSDPLVDIWKKFSVVIQEAEGLGSFPFLSIANSLTEIGKFVTESDEFDMLYVALTDALAERSSEGEAATKNVQRAYQKLHKGLPYEAIRWFGRAAHLLVKEEYEGQLIKALVGSGSAYEEAGLLWAARNCVLAALSSQFQTFRKSASIPDISPALLGHYFWAELKLGRLPQILTAHELELIVRNARARTDGEREKISEVEMEHARMIGALLLRTPFQELAAIDRLPDALDRLAIPFARAALLYPMGYEDELRAEGYIPAEETTDGVTNFFNDWYAKGTVIGLPDKPDYALGDRVYMRSHVLGCEVTLETANNLTSIGIAEAILGTLEALLATSLNHRMLPLLDRLVVRVFPEEISDGVPKLEFVDEDGEPVGLVTHPKRLVFNDREEATSFPSWLKDSVIRIMLKFTVPAEYEAWGKAVFEDESAFARSLTFSNIPVMLGNLFGEKSELSIDDWIESGDRSYPPKGLASWTPPEEPSDVRSLGDARRGEGDPPEGFFDPEKLRHSDMKVVSPIDIKKWDAARWDAVMFIVVPSDDKQYPPILGLSYKNREPARSIFEGFIKRFGKDDLENALCITIVRGVSAKNPLAYGVIVGPNMEKMPMRSGNFVMFASRIQWMYPSSQKNLDGFLEAFHLHKRYLLVPSHFPTRNSTPDPMFDLALGKHHLKLREAWKIGENDPDTSVLDLDDPPFIPPDQPNAPVLKAIEQLRRFRTRGQG